MQKPLRFLPVPPHPTCARSHMWGSPTSATGSSQLGCVIPSFFMLTRFLCSGGLEGALLVESFIVLMYFLFVLWGFRAILLLSISMRLKLGGTQGCSIASTALGGHAMQLPEGETTIRITTRCLGLPDAERDQVGN